MPTHYTIMCFRFRTRQIDGIECGLFSIHALLGQTTLRVGRVYMYSVTVLSGMMMIRREKVKPGAGS